MQWMIFNKDMVKRFLSATIVMAAIAGSVMANPVMESDNGKVLTMEEAVMGAVIPRVQFTAWSAEGSEYVFPKGSSLVATNAADGKEREVMSLQELNSALGSNLKGFPNFTFCAPGKMSIMNGGRYVIVDLTTKSVEKAIQLPKGATEITYNAKRNGVAFAKDNNLFFSDGNQIAITNEKDKNIVSGTAVSRNEFGITNGIFWAPDGEKVAYYQKDESNVTTFPLLDITTRTGSLVELKYPMNGMKSEIVSLFVYDFKSGKSTKMQVTDFDEERYLTNITWSPESDKIYIQVLNRAQKEMHLNAYCAVTGKFINTLFVDKDSKFMEPICGLHFIPNQSDKFIYVTNSRDGYKSLYLHSTDGKLIKRLTNVDADVEFIACDGKKVYYTSAEVSPIDNHLFSVDIKSGKSVRLTKEEGWHRVAFSADYKFFTDTYSSLHVPTTKSVVKNNGTVVKVLTEGKNPAADYNFGEVTIGTVKSADGKYDNYYRLIKPMDFDSTKVYPVILYVYGGPHSQLVKNSWLAEIRYWEMYMAQHGYVVFVMDNRGTPNRGAEYEREIHKNCGQAEMADQVKGMEWLLSHSWCDKNRVGVHGWSYGGFMTISLITNYPELFKVAVAGGPVIDWKWYEIMYGERYMETAATNPEGFAKSSLINKAKDLKGKLLICQGAIDNVVVWEHSLSFIRECIKNNVQVDYFPYPCAEHNVMGKDRIHLMQKVTNYFEDYL